MALPSKVLLLVPSAIVAFSLTTASTSSYFSDSGSSSQNLFTALIPTPTPTPPPSAHLVINEVYYQVDPSKGFDSSGDSSSTTGCGNETVLNTGNNVIVNHFCNSLISVVVNNSNSGTVNQSSTTTTNTGGNQANGNIGGGTVNSGDTTVDNSFFTNLNQNVTNINLGGQNNEWIELYNPTTTAISLQDWTLTDNSGIARTIHANVSVMAHGFALIAKDASTWSHWTIPANASKVELGHQIGDGLDNGGDRLILKNPQGLIVDQLSYGADTTIFNPAINLVPLGDSFARQPVGFDTNSATDFIDTHPPTPGG